MAKVYAVTDYDGCPYITAGKRYEALDATEKWFGTYDDFGTRRSFRWNDEPSIGGFDWQRIEEPEVDWSKAPEGATHFSPPAYWYKKDHNGWFIWHIGMSVWVNSTEANRRHVNMIPRPDQPQWDGKSWPPVGAECEYLEAGKGRWSQAKVVGYDGPSCVVAIDGAGYSGSCDIARFRPLQSERDRVIEAAINAMKRAFDRNAPNWSAEAKAQALYDAGMLKMPEDSQA